MCATSVSGISNRSAKHPRRNFAANLWIFHSNKNGRYLHIEGDLPFMHCMLMEGMLEIAGYQPPIQDPSPGSVSPLQSRAYSIAWNPAGAQTWFGYYRAASMRAEPLKACEEALRSEAVRVGAHSEMVSDRQLERQRILFDNWLMLSRAMTAAGSFAREAEAQELADLLNGGRPFALGRALQLPQCDPAIMLALVGRALQLGRAKADLTTALLGPATQIVSPCHDRPVPPQAN